MIYCDASGRLNPDGEFELRDGKLIIRDGRRVSHAVLFRDSALPSDTASADEQRFIASAEGQAAIAYARSSFEMGEAYKPVVNRVGWTPAMEIAVARASMRQATVARDAGEPFAQSVRAQAAEHAKSLADQSLNAWRSA